MHCLWGYDPKTKPHPEPLLHAARLLDVAPATCIYVGDDVRDIQAATAASMRSVAACYGYLGDGAPPEQWGADQLIQHPLELWDHLRSTA